MHNKPALFFKSKKKTLKNLSQIMDKLCKAIEEENFQRTSSIISNLKNK